MAHRAEELSIRPRQASQQLRVRAVILALVARDQSQLPRIRDGRADALRFRQAAYPRRVAADFEGHLSRREACEERLQRVTCRPSGSLTDRSAGLVDDEVARVPVAEVQRQEVRGDGRKLRGKVIHGRPPSWFGVWHTSPL